MRPRAAGRLLRNAALAALLAAPSAASAGCPDRPVPSVQLKKAPDPTADAVPLPNADLVAAQAEITLREVVAALAARWELTHTVPDSSTVVADAPDWTFSKLTGVVGGGGPDGCAARAAAPTKAPPAPLDDVATAARIARQNDVVRDVRLEELHSLSEELARLPPPSDDDQ
jgi:hypothetical protein